MRENLEAKWQVSDLETVRARAERAGASFQWRRAQRDVFFAVTQGRLKLRVTDEGKAELIAYFRPDEPGRQASRYIIARVDEPEALLSALSSTVGVLAEVRKQRTLLLWRNVRVHLDEVEGLGTFVELESVVDADTPRDAAAANFEELASKLDLRPDKTVGKAYVDLVLANDREGGRP